MMDKSITERLNKKKTTKRIHLSGLLTILANLSTDLEELLYEEKRLFGKAKQYMKDLDSIFKTIIIDDSPEIRVEYNQIKYLYKPIIIKEFSYLVGKKLSKADSIIVILNRFLSILESYESEWKDQIKKCKEIITNFFERIKYNTKYINLSYLTNSMNDLIQLNSLGRYELNYITVQNLVNASKESNNEENKTFEKTMKLSEIEL